MRGPQPQQKLSSDSHPSQQLYTPTTAASAWFSAASVEDKTLVVVPTDTLSERQRARLQFGERLLASMGSVSDLQRVDCTQLTLVAASSLPPAESGHESAAKLGYCLRIEQSQSAA